MRRTLLTFVMNNKENSSYFLPSEVCRLVLGFLKEEGYMSTYKSFLNECPHLLEYQSLLKRGMEYPTTILGLKLINFLNDSWYMKHKSNSGQAECLQPTSRQLQTNLLSQHHPSPSNVRTRYYQSARTSMLKRLSIGLPHRDNPANQIWARVSHTITPTSAIEVFTPGEDQLSPSCTLPTSLLSDDCSVDGDCMPSDTSVGDHGNACGRKTSTLSSKAGCLNVARASISTTSSIARSSSICTFQTAMSSFVAGSSSVNVLNIENVVCSNLDFNSMQNDIGDVNHLLSRRPASKSHSFRHSVLSDSNTPNNDRLSDNHDGTLSMTGKVDSTPQEGVTCDVSRTSSSDRSPSVCAPIRCCHHQVPECSREDWVVFTTAINGSAHVLLGDVDGSVSQMLMIDTSSSSPFKAHSGKRRKKLPLKRNNAIMSSLDGKGHERQLDWLVDNDRFVNTLVDSINSNLCHDPVLPQHSLSIPAGAANAGDDAPTLRMSVDPVFTIDENSCLEEFLNMVHPSTGKGVNFSSAGWRNRADSLVQMWRCVPSVMSVTNRMTDQALTSIVNMTENDPVCEELYALFHEDGGDTRPGRPNDLSTPNILSDAITNPALCSASDQHRKLDNRCNTPHSESHGHSMSEDLPVRHTLSIGNGDLGNFPAPNSLSNGIERLEILHILPHTVSCDSRKYNGVDTVPHSQIGDFLLHPISSMSTISCTGEHCCRGCQTSHTQLASFGCQSAHAISVGQSTPLWLHADKDVFDHQAAHEEENDDRVDTVSSDNCRTVFSQAQFGSVTGSMRSYSVPSTVSDSLQSAGCAVATSKVVHKDGTSSVELSYLFKNTDTIHTPKCLECYVALTSNAPVNYLASIPVLSPRSGMHHMIDVVRPEFGFQRVNIPSTGCVGEKQPVSCVSSSRDFNNGLVNAVSSSAFISHTDRPCVDGNNSIIQTCLYAADVVKSFPSCLECHDSDCHEPDFFHDSDCHEPDFFHDSDCHEPDFFHDSDCHEPDFFHDSDCHEPDFFHDSDCHEPDFFHISLPLVAKTLQSDNGKCRTVMPYHRASGDDLCCLSQSCCQQVKTSLFRSGRIGVPFHSNSRLNRLMRRHTSPLSSNVLRSMSSVRRAKRVLYKSIRSRIRELSASVDATRLSLRMHNDELGNAGFSRVDDSVGGGSDRCEDDEACSSLVRLHRALMSVREVPIACVAGHGAPVFNRTGSVVPIFTKHKKGAPVSTQTGRVEPVLNQPVICAPVFNQAGMVKPALNQPNKSVPVFSQTDGVVPIVKQPNKGVPVLKKVGGGKERKKIDRRLLLDRNLSNRVVPLVTLRSESIPVAKRRNGVLGLKQSCDGSNRDKMSECVIVLTGGTCSHISSTTRVLEPSNSGFLMDSFSESAVMMGHVECSGLPPSYSSLSRHQSLPSDECSHVELDLCPHGMLHNHHTMSVCGPYALSGRTVITQGISKQCVLPTAAIMNMCALSDSGMPLTRLTTSSPHRELSSAHALPLADCDKGVGCQFSTSQSTSQKACVSSVGICDMASSAGSCQRPPDVLAHNEDSCQEPGQRGDVLSHDRTCDTLIELEDRLSETDYRRCRNLNDAHGYGHDRPLCERLLAIRSKKQGFVDRLMLPFGERQEEDTEPSQDEALISSGMDDVLAASDVSNILSDTVYEYLSQQIQSRQLQSAADESTHDYVFTQYPATSSERLLLGKSLRSESAGDSLIHTNFASTGCLRHSSADEVSVISATAPNRIISAKFHRSETAIMKAFVVEEQNSGHSILNAGENSKFQFRRIALSMTSGQERHINMSLRPRQAMSRINVCKNTADNLTAEPVSLATTAASAKLLNSEERHFLQSGIIRECYVKLAHLPPVRQSSSHHPTQFSLSNDITSVPAINDAVTAHRQEGISLTERRFACFHTAPSIGAVMTVSPQQTEPSVVISVCAVSLKDFLQQTFVAPTLSSQAIVLSPTVINNSLSRGCVQSSTIQTLFSSNAHVTMVFSDGRRGAIRPKVMARLYDGDSILPNGPGKLADHSHAMAECVSCNHDGSFGRPNLKRAADDPVVVGSSASSLRFRKSAAASGRSGLSRSGANVCRKLQNVDSYRSGKQRNASQEVCLAFVTSGNGILGADNSSGIETSGCLQSNVIDIPAENPEHLSPSVGTGVLTSFSVISHNSSSSCRGAVEASCSGVSVSICSMSERKDNSLFRLSSLAASKRKSLHSVIHYIAKKRLAVTELSTPVKLNIFLPRNLSLSRHNGMPGKDGVCIVATLHDPTSKLERVVSGRDCTKRSTDGSKVRPADRPAMVTQYELSGRAMKSPMSALTVISTSSEQSEQHCGQSHLGGASLVRKLTNMSGISSVGCGGNGGGVSIFSAPQWSSPVSCSPSTVPQVSPHALASHHALVSPHALASPHAQSSLSFRSGKQAAVANHVPGTASDFTELQKACHNSGQAQSGCNPPDRSRTKGRSMQSVLLYGDEFSSGQSSSMWSATFPVPRPVFTSTSFVVSSTLASVTDISRCLCRDQRCSDSVSVTGMSPSDCNNGEMGGSPSGDTYTEKAPVATSVNIPVCGDHSVQTTQCKEDNHDKEKRTSHSTMIAKPVWRVSGKIWENSTLFGLEKSMNHLPKSGKASCAQSCRRKCRNNRLVDKRKTDTPFVCKNAEASFSAPGIEYPLSVGKVVSIGNLSVDVEQSLSSFLQHDGDKLNSTSVLPIESVGSRAERVTSTGSVVSQCVREVPLSQSVPNGKKTGCARNSRRTLVRMIHQSQTGGKSTCKQKTSLSSVWRSPSQAGVGNQQGQVSSLHHSPGMCSVVGGNPDSVPVSSKKLSSIHSVCAGRHLPPSFRGTRVGGGMCEDTLTTLSSLLCEKVEMLVSTEGNHRQRLRSKPEVRRKSKSSHNTLAPTSHDGLRNVGGWGKAPEIACVVKTRPSLAPIRQPCRSLAKGSKAEQDNIDSYVSLHRISASLLKTTSVLGNCRMSLTELIAPCSCNVRNIGRSDECVVKGACGKECKQSFANCIEWCAPCCGLKMTLAQETFVRVSGSNADCSTCGQRQCDRVHCCICTGSKGLKRKMYDQGHLLERNRRTANTSCEERTVTLSSVDRLPSTDSVNGCRDESQSHSALSTVPIPGDISQCLGNFRNTTKSLTLKVLHSTGRKAVRLTVPVDTCPVASTVDMCPVASAVDMCPVASTVDTCPVVSTVDMCPVVSTVDTCPVVSTVDTCPVASTLDTCPVVSTVDACPVASTVDTCPVASTVDTCPVASTVDTCPVASTVDTCPVASTVDTCPVASTATDTESDCCDPVTKSNSHCQERCHTLQYDDGQSDSTVGSSRRNTGLKRNPMSANLGGAVVKQSADMVMGKPAKVVSYERSYSTLNRKLSPQLETMKEARRAVSRQRSTATKQASAKRTGKCSSSGRNTVSMTSQLLNDEDVVIQVLKPGI